MKIKKILELLKFNRWIMIKIDKLIKMGLPIQYGRGIKLAYAIFKFTFTIKLNYILAIYIALTIIFLRGTSVRLNKNINLILEEKIIKILLGVSTIMFFYRVLNMIVYIMF